jgi:tRNA-dihydrouridine synthase B
LLEGLAGRTVTPGFPRRIGGVEVENPIWLAPMAGITFSSVRLFFRRMGAALVHTEMVSALGLCHKGRKTRELLHMNSDERPAVLQIFGSDAENALRGAEIALELGCFDAIEVNMACPMPKVTKKGSGSKLLEDPRLACGIVSALKSLSLPVWAKIRLLEEKDATGDFCARLFSAGAGFIFVHGRTAAQRYGGTASREAVELCARRFPGLIGGTGDCYEPSDFKDYIDRGCASVLAGRGFLRDAYLIPRTLALLGASVPEDYLHPDIKEQAHVLLELGRNIYNTEGESAALVMARRMMGALFKGFPGAAKLRGRAAQIRSWAAMEDLFAEPEYAAEALK